MNMKLHHAHDYISQAFLWASTLAHSSKTKTGNGNQTDQLCVYVCAARCGTVYPINYVVDILADPLRKMCQASIL